MSESFYIGPPLDNYESLREDLLPGANVLVLCNRLTYPRVCCDVEDAGFELRDCITILTPGEPILVTVAMKPLDGTFVDNALKHGVAGYNIDGSRIRVDKDDPNRRPNRKSHDLSYKPENYALRFRSGLKSANIYDEGAHNSKGRYPTNLILMHHPDCECMGTKKVKSRSGGSASGPSHHGTSDSVARGSFNGVQSTPFYMDSEGNDEIDDWVCAEGCPVKALDEQSGERRSTLTGRADPNVVHGHPGSQIFKGEKVSYAYASDPSSKVYADSGGASRFFKQVMDEDDLFAYLKGLIAPPRHKTYEV